MDSYVAQGLFWISIFALLFMMSVLAEDWIKKYRSKGNYNYYAESDNVKQAADDHALLVLSVMAKPGESFASYDLLQAITAAGLQYGDMNIFHYYDQDQQKSLFSLVSAEEPGEFNIDQIGNFSCKGLMLFMQLDRTTNLRNTFRLMLNTAERLAEDLEGLVCADPKTPWTHEVEEKYSQKIGQFQPAGI